MMMDMREPFEPLTSTVSPAASAASTRGFSSAAVLAQNGRGMQSSDAIGAPNGGNCYACHQITKKEISFGNIGPSLAGYGKLRGSSE